MGEPTSVTSIEGREARGKPALEGVRDERGASARHIAAELEQWIQRGLYASGDRIRERTLAARFGVSRAPVREALRLLESRGLVSIEPMRGAAVSTLGHEEREELADIGAALLSLAMGRAAVRGTADTGRALARRADELEGIVETASGELFSSRAMALVLDALAMARSPHLAHMANNVLARGAPVLLSPDILASRAVRQRVARVTRQLVEAIVARRADRAESLMRRLCERARRPAPRAPRRRARTVNA